MTRQSSVVDKLCNTSSCLCNKLMDFCTSISCFLFSLFFFSKILFEKFLPGNWPGNEGKESDRNECNTFPSWNQSRDVSVCIVPIFAPRTVL